MNIEWKDSYRIGDEAIDRQHQELFTLANAMFAATEKAELLLCAIQLFKHVREHFADEEALMKMVGFPGYQAHVESHNLILKKLGEVSHSIGNGCDGHGGYYRIPDRLGLEPHPQCRRTGCCLHHRSKPLLN
jgi:hemerythrin-like metal-binding protein